MPCQKISIEEFNVPFRHCASGWPVKLVSTRHKTGTEFRLNAQVNFIKDYSLSLATSWKFGLSVGLYVARFSHLAKVNGVVERDVYVGRAISKHINLVAMFMLGNIVQQKESVRQIWGKTCIQKWDLHVFVIKNKRLLDFCDRKSLPLLGQGSCFATPGTFLTSPSSSSLVMNV